MEELKTANEALEASEQLRARLLKGSVPVDALALMGSRLAQARAGLQTLVLANNQEAIDLAGSLETEIELLIKAVAKHATSVTQVQHVEVMNFS